MWRILSHTVFEEHGESDTRVENGEFPMMLHLDFGMRALSPPCERCMHRNENVDPRNIIGSSAGDDGLVKQYQLQTHKISWHIRVKQLIYIDTNSCILHLISTRSRHHLYL